MLKLAFPLTLLFVLSLLLPAAASDPDDGTLSAGEREELLRLLEDSETRLLELIGELNEAQWSYKPATDRWSVAECVEHIVRSERALFASVERAMAGDPDPDWAEKTEGKAELLRRVMPNRNPGGAGGAQAPQEIRPQGGQDRDQMVEEFRAFRGKVQAYVEKVEQPLKQHIEVHPFEFFGDLNAYDWLIYVPLHTVRHSKQIVEVLESSGYPE